MHGRGAGLEDHHFVTTVHKDRFMQESTYAQVRGVKFDGGAGYLHGG